MDSENASFQNYKHFLFKLYVFISCLVLTFHELYFYSSSKVNKELLDRSVWNWNQSLFKHLRVKILFINLF